MSLPLPAGRGCREAAGEGGLTRLFLVGHGATQLTAGNRFSGSTRVDLPHQGREQARHPSRRLATEKLAAVYASPYSRTLETAQLIAEPHKLQMHTREGLREISHGHWEGLTRTEVEQKFGNEYQLWESDPFTFAPKDGESGVE